MGNLGAYQDIVTKAASVGGVEKLVGMIEKGAVSKAAPKLVASGITIGVGVVAAGLLAYDGGKKLVRNYRRRQEAAASAKEQLKAQFENAADAETDAQAEADDRPTAIDKE